MTKILQKFLFVKNSAYAKAWGSHTCKYIFVLWSALQNGFDFGGYCQYPFNLQYHSVAPKANNQTFTHVLRLDPVCAVVQLPPLSVPKVTSLKAALGKSTLRCFWHVGHQEVRHLA